MSAGASQQELTKLRPLELPALVARANLPEEATTKVARCISALDALATLEASGLRLEAARLFAHTLPNREAVWWACMCARHTAPANLAALERAALEAAEIWVRQQTDEVRHDAMSKAQQAGLQTPEAWAGFAAFLSGDSMSLPNLPKVPPAPHLTGDVVGGAVQLASVRGDPTRQPARLTLFLQSARDIAAGGTGWLEPG